LLLIHLFFKTEKQLDPQVAYLYLIFALDYLKQIIWGWRQLSLHFWELCQ